MWPPDLYELLWLLVLEGVTEWVLRVTVMVVYLVVAVVIVVFPSSVTEGLELIDRLAEGAMNAINTTVK